jgi:hypothetical protein
MNSLFKQANYYYYTHAYIFYIFLLINQATEIYKIEFGIRDQSNIHMNCHHEFKKTKPHSMQHANAKPNFN